MSRFHKRDGGNLVKIPTCVVRCSRDETLRAKNVSAQSSCGKLVPQRKIPRSKERGIGIGAGDRGRTGTVSPPPDFESGTSANSITPAGILNASIIHDIISKIKIIFRAGDLFQHSARKLTFLCKLWQKRNAFC